MSSFNGQNNNYRRAALSSSALLLMAVSAPSVLAQEVKAAIASQNGDGTNTEEVEVIEVTGVRSALESALNVKREANSIVDAISAEDINGLPALDMGEALQAIPGIQVNREGERRTSDINLRGLPGSFVKVTANGQSFTTPSRSASPVGSPNPFGSFDPSVFDGVTVIKSPTAAHQEGGIAGIVDKKLPSSLRKPDGRYTVSVGTRYEDLKDGFDTEFKLSASKHFIEDVFAGALKVGYSDQNFRRDSVLFARKEFVDSNTYDEYDTWKADMVSQGLLPENAVVKASSTVQQLAEVSRGDRISVAGNLEFKPTKNWELGLDVLYTKRDLKDGNFEQVSSEVRNRGTRTWRGQQIIPDPNTVPFLTGYGDDGTPIYAISRVTLENAAYVPANRIFGFFEEAKGAFFDFEYVGNDWSFDGIVSKSKSENEFNQTGFDFRLQGSTSGSIQPTGVTTVIDTGQGNLDNMFVSMDGWQGINYDQAFKTGNPLNLNVGDVSDPRKLDFYVLGRHDNPKRDMESIDLNLHKEFDFEIIGDAFVLNTLHFGGRYSSETLENEDYTPSSGGINVANIGSDFLSDQILAESQNPWFNGKIPGGAGSEGGWYTLDTAYIVEQLQDGLVISDEFTEIPSSGFIARTERNTDNVLDRWETNFDATEEITAAYLMADFAGELGSVFYSGNLGVRYVTTDVTIDGAQQEYYDGNQYRIVDMVTENSYDHVLPSFNAAFELRDDLVARFALSKGLVRPNIRAQTPVLTVQEGENSVRVDFPKSDVEPYTSDNFDLSLEWYNREGSAISIGFFQKDITGLFQEEVICPMPGEPNAEELTQQTGDLIREDFADGTFICTQQDPYEQEDGDIINRTANIKRFYNSASTIEVTGYELAVQQKLDFLPYPWNGLGGVLNYSYVENETLNEGAEDKGDGLIGISPNSYNLITYYENDGFSIRLAYNYRDEYKLDGGASFGGPDQKNVKARGQLDLSASYEITKNLKVAFRGYNLTDELRYEYVGEDARNVSRINYDGRTYSANISYTFQ
ncbi:TonB-dependent receptor [Thalassotalea litorea]|uniref:TonB-dependent receptor n=1 Tax=Thalassotalea litorea TaxID=2020715 RepID=A0A5R9IKB8_9GAMM|nr:TonB-dependent receptor [Thalassotalea litorea]TLU65732.1 TonB-dependent receptor [Thalassotalea litorea]